MYPPQLYIRNVLYKTTLWIQCCDSFFLIIFTCVPHLNFTWEPGAEKDSRLWSQADGRSNDGCVTFY